MNIKSWFCNHDYKLIDTLEQFTIPDKVLAVWYISRCEKCGKIIKYKIKA